MNWSIWYLAAAYFVFWAPHGLGGEAKTQTLQESKYGFELRSIRLGSKEILVEVADNEKKRRQGLMGRKKLEKDRGMLFVFPSQRQRSFWMKNTHIPLSLAFFDKKGRLLETADLNPPSLAAREVPRYTSRQPAKYVLEMNQGWFKKNKLHLGKTVRLKILGPKYRRK